MWSGGRANGAARRAASRGRGRFQQREGGGACRAGVWCALLVDEEGSHKSIYFFLFHTSTWTLSLQAFSSYSPSIFLCVAPSTSPTSTHITLPNMESKQKDVISSPLNPAHYFAYASAAYLFSLSLPLLLFPRVLLLLSTPRGAAGQATNEAGNAAQNSVSALGPELTPIERFASYAWGMTMITLAVTAIVQVSGLDDESEGSRHSADECTS